MLSWNISQCKKVRLFSCKMVYSFTDLLMHVVIIFFIQDRFKLNKLEISKKFQYFFLSIPVRYHCLRGVLCEYLLFFTTYSWIKTLHYVTNLTLYSFYLQPKQIVHVLVKIQDTFQKYIIKSIYPSSKNWSCLRNDILRSIKQNFGVKFHLQILTNIYAIELWHFKNR